MNNIPFETEQYFGLQIPTTVAGIPTEFLNPAHCWENLQDYHKQTDDLALHFRSHSETLSKSLQGVIRFEVDIFSSNLRVKYL